MTVPVPKSLMKIGVPSTLLLVIQLFSSASKIPSLSSSKSILSVTPSPSLSEFATTVIVTVAVSQLVGFAVSQILYISVYVPLGVLFAT